MLLRALALPPALPFLLLLTLLACGPAPRPAMPALWDVRDADTRIYLFGSVHELPSDIDWLRGPVLAAANDADELVLELAPAETALAPALLAQMATDEAVPPLSDRLSSADRSATLESIAPMGFDAARADRTESWVLALAAGSARVRGEDFRARYGVEARLTALFTATSRPVRGIETARAQLSLFDALPPVTQDRLLAFAVSNDAALPPRALVDGWARGDVALLMRETDRQMAGVPGLAEPLVHRRNRAFADWVMARLDRPGTIILAVGAGHLAGPTGVPVQLRARGLTVRRIQ